MADIKFVECKKGATAKIDKKNPDKCINNNCPLRKPPVSCKGNVR